MSNLTKIGKIQYGEKYEKNGETKWSNTDLGTLFKDKETGEYVVNYLGRWCKVWPEKMKDDGYKAAKQAAAGPESNSQDDDSDSVPF